MGTLRHRNQLVREPADRKITVKKPKTPRNGGRFVRNLLLTAGIATEIIATSLLKAQGNIKDQVNRPTDKQTEIMMAASGEKTPANTYVVPRTDGEEKKDAKKVEPDPGQKWCDGIEIENGQLIFKGISAHGKKGDAVLPFEDLLRKCGISDATTSDIKWKELRVINGEKKAFFVVETETKSVLITSNPDFEKADSTWGKALDPIDNSKIFTHPGSIYIMDNGTVVATTPTTLLVIRSGKNGKKTLVNYKDALGVPPLEYPQIGSEATYIKITDDTTMQGDNTLFKLIFDLSSCKIGIFEKNTELLGQR